MAMWLINHMDKFINHNGGPQDCLTSVEPLGLNLKFCVAPIRHSGCKSKTKRISKHKIGMHTNEEHKLCSRQFTLKNKPSRDYANKWEGKFESSYKPSQIIFTNSIINEMWLWKAEGSAKHGFSDMI
jgi:hypothetical protein